MRCSPSCRRRRGSSRRWWRQRPGRVPSGRRRWTSLRRRVRRLVLNADDPEKNDARKERDELTTKYPLQKDAIAAYIAAHEELMLRNGGGVSDAAELKRLVTKAGVLDFRIAVQPIGAEISD